MRSNQLSYAPLSSGGQCSMRPCSRQALPASGLVCAAVLVMLLSACQLRELIPPVNTPAPTSASPPASDWQTIAPGLELHRSLATGSLFGQAYALRVDPRLFQLRAHYEPGEARSFEDWLDALPGVVAFINANFFDSDFHINGLLVADGVSHGRPWLTRGGTLLLRDGLPILQQNQMRPWQVGDLQQAVQGFPMLVLNGQPAYRRSGPPARRSVVALDRSGRVLLLATPLLGPSLADMAAWLAASDLDIESALNLDGGGSTMFYVNASDPLRLPSLDAVPALLAVWPT